MDISTAQLENLLDLSKKNARLEVIQAKTQSEQEAINKLKNIT
jgi:hypothetical protein